MSTKCIARATAELFPDGSVKVECYPNWDDEHCTRDRSESTTKVAYGRLVDILQSHEEDKRVLARLLCLQAGIAYLNGIVVANADMRSSSMCNKCNPGPCDTHGGYEKSKPDETPTSDICPGCVDQSLNGMHTCGKDNDVIDPASVVKNEAEHELSDIEERQQAIEARKDILRNRLGVSDVK